MPTLSAGNERQLEVRKLSNGGIRRGVTLIEMMVVVAIVAMMAGIAFPALTSGLDGIRLRSAADSVASFLNTALNRAERRQDVIAVVVSPKLNRLALLSSEPGYVRTLEMPSGIAIAGDAERRLVLMPGGSFPRFSIDLVNSKGAKKRVAIDAITGAPQITDLREPAS